MIRCLTRRKRSQRSGHARRRGATLIDVATGSMLLALLLIPSVHLIGKSQSLNRRLSDRDTMLFEAEQLVESTKISLSESPAFNSALAKPIDTVSKIAVPDGPPLLGRVRVAEDASLPAAQLLTIVVDVWCDSDGDANLDAGESSETLRTQWAAP